VPLANMNATNDVSHHYLTWCRRGVAACRVVLFCNRVGNVFIELRLKS